MAIRKIVISIIIVFIIIGLVKVANASELVEKFNADSFQKLDVDEKIAFVQKVLDYREAMLQNFEYKINMKALNVKPSGEETGTLIDESWNIKRKANKLFFDIGRYNTKNNLMNFKATWNGSVGKSLWYDPDGSVIYDAVINNTEDNNFTNRSYNYILGLRIPDTQENLTLPEWFKDANEQGKFIDINIIRENDKELIACDIIHGYKSYQWFLDVGRDYMPVRAEILYKKDKNYNSSTFVVSEAIEADGFWVPTKVIHTSGTSVVEEVTRHTYVVSKFTRNTVKDEDLIINYPVGTKISDRTENVLYQVLPDGEKEIIRFYDPNELGITSIEELRKKLEAIVEKAKEPQPVLLNKSLPELTEFGIDLLSKDTNNKTILICFFDIEQRPSRNCIQELNKKAQELKEKDIEIIAINTLKIEREYLDEWLNEYNINFPVGMISDREEETRINWGVKALPWLILTDKENIVQAEGFGVTELDSKLSELDNN